MKTKNRILVGFITLMISSVLLLGTFATTKSFSSVAETLTASERTVELNYDFLDDQSISDEFDEYSYQTNDNGFDFVAKKAFDMSLFSELDLVGLNENEDQVVIRYDVQYVDDETTILLTVTIEGEEDIPLTETIPGLITYNSAGETDVMFAVDGEYIWLSELTESGQLDEVSWLSNYIKNKIISAQKAINNFFNDLAKNVVPKLKPAIHAVVNKVVAIKGDKWAADKGAEFLDMYVDEIGIYHADIDCWQQKFGYIDFYDIVFDGATSMRNAKFPFDVDGDGEYDYIIWAWKGDYLNLGAGAELGIYRRSDIWADAWKVDKGLAMEMTLQLDCKGENIINWQPAEKQWWITGFRYDKPHVDRDELTAAYTVTFNSEKGANKTMYKAFKEKWDGEYKSLECHDEDMHIYFTL